MGGLSLPLVYTNWKMYIFPVLQPRAGLLILDTDSFSSFPGNLFAVLIYYPEVGDVSSGLVVGKVMFVYCTGDMTIVFFYSMFQTSAGFSYMRKVALFFWEGPFIDYVLF